MSDKFTREVRPPEGLKGDLPVIYCFANGRGGDWIPCLAIAEDGHVVANHVCSHPDWGKHDLGLTSDWKHEEYFQHYPNGFVLEWVDNPMPGSNVGFDAALLKNRELKEKAGA